MSERFLLPVGLKDYRTQDVKKIDFVSSIFLDEAGHEWDPWFR